MNYNEFKDALVSSVKERLDASIFVEIRSITKNNGVSLDALVIRNTAFNISPSLYINHLYGAYLNGESIESIAEHLIELNNSSQLKKDFDTSFISSFEKAKDKIIYKLVNYEKNKEQLKNVPFIEFLDLAIVFFYKIDNDFLDEGYIMVHDFMMNHWNVTKEELYSIAKENTKRIYKIKVVNVFDFLCDKMSDDEKRIFCIENIPFFLLTNEQAHYGSNCLLDSDTLSSLSEMHESDLYIIPSSIHETLFIPENNAYIDVDYLLWMIKEVNATCVPEHEYLSDHVYIFRKDEKKLDIAG